MNKWLLCALAGCLALSVSWGHGNRVGPDVLIFDLKKVVDDCDEYADLVGKWQGEADKLKEKYGTQVKNLQAQQRALLKKTLSLRGAKWYPDVEKSLKEEGNLKAIEAFHRVQFGDKILRGMQALMLSAEEAATAIRVARKAHIVFISKLSPIKIESENDLNIELVSRRVLSFDKNAGVDITDEVLKRMNAAYKARKKAQGN